MRGYLNQFQNREIRHAYGKALDQGDVTLAENIRKNHPDLSKEFDKEDQERKVTANT